MWTNLVLKPRASPTANITLISFQHAGDLSHPRRIRHDKATPIIQAIMAKYRIMHGHRAPWIIMINGEKQQLSLLQLRQVQCIIFRLSGDLNHPVSKQIIDRHNLDPIAANTLNTEGTPSPHIPDIAYRDDSLSLQIHVTQKKSTKTNIKGRHN